MPPARLLTGCVRGLSVGDFGGFGGQARVEVFAAQAVAVAFEGEDLGVVDEPVDHGGGGHVVAEDFSPGGERFVGGDDHREALVAGGHQREHQAGGFGVEWDVGA